MISHFIFSEYVETFEETQTGRSLLEYLASQTALAEAQRRQVEDRIAFRYLQTFNGFVQALFTEPKEGEVLLIFTVAAAWKYLNSHEEFSKPHYASMGDMIEARLEEIAKKQGGGEA